MNYQFDDVDVWLAVVMLKIIISNINHYLYFTRGLKQRAMQCLRKFPVYLMIYL
jgi:hypothetical protein